MLFHTESLEASWPEAVVEAEAAAAAATAAAVTATSTLLFLKALLPPAEAVPRCEDDDDGFLDLMDLT